MLNPAESIVIVASAETALKSSPVRHMLEQRLIDDLRTSLTKDGFADFTVVKHAGRLMVRGLSDSKSAARSCAKVFGVTYAAPALLPPASMRAVLQTLVQVASESLQHGQSFAIRCRRSARSFLSRRDIEIQGGSELLRALGDRSTRVDLKRPDVTIFVDLAGDQVYVYSCKLRGPGGLPLSAHWKMLAVLDSGVLSIIASYAMMRRGCLVQLFVPVSDTVPAFGRGYQLGLAKKLRPLVSRTRYGAFTLSVEQLIAGTSDGRILGFADCKRLVRTAASSFAKEKRFKGVVVSDVTGVMGANREVEAAPSGEHPEPSVFCPLIGFEMDDLLEISREIGISREELVAQLNLEHRFMVPREGQQLQEGLSRLVVQEILL